MSKAKKYNWQQLPIVKQILDFTKKYSMPGFDGIPIYNVVSFVIQEVQKDNISTRANSIAFSFFLSIFPFTIFIFTLLPHLPFTADYVKTIGESLKNFLPANAHEFLMNIIYDITSIKRKGLLSVGFFLALFFSSSGMLTLMSGFDKTYDITFKNRPYFRKYLIAIGLTIIMGLLFLASVVLVVLSGPLWHLIDSHNQLPISSEVIIKTLGWFVIFFLLYTGFTMIYKFGPSMYRRVKYINPGSLLSTILSILTSVGFSWFVDQFGRYNELYGSIGALIVILLWLQYNAYILVIGFELNAAIAVNKDILSEA